MKKIFTTSIFLFFCFIVFSQQKADFEDINLKKNTFRNGSDGSGGFTSGGFRFKNNFNFDWFSWDGFAVSSVTDNQTKGWENQYSAKPGKGALETPSYTVAWTLYGTSVVDFAETTLSGFYVTNNTYSYYTMKEGDFFSKKFGGADGNDPDFFKLSITGFRKGGGKAGTVDFYLADFRFQNNNQDYIVDDWQWIDLTSLGEVVKLDFSLSSSDNGAWGMNTPAYFCLDQLNHTDQAPVVVNPVADIVRERTFREEIRIPLLPVFSDTDSPGERIVYSLEKVQDSTIVRAELTSVFISQSPFTKDAWVSLRLTGKIGQSDITIAAVSGGKKSTETFMVTAAALTASGLISETEIKIYPNPFTDRFLIDYGNKSVSQFILTDSSGRKHHQREAGTGGKCLFDGLAGLPVGTYYLGIADNPGFRPVRLLKIR